VPATGVARGDSPLSPLSGKGWQEYDCIRKHLIGLPGAVSLAPRDERRWP